MSVGSRNTNSKQQQAAATGYTVGQTKLMWWLFLHLLKNASLKRSLVATSRSSSHASDVSAKQCQIMFFRCPQSISRRTPGDSIHKNRYFFALCHDLYTVQQTAEDKCGWLLSHSSKPEGLMKNTKIEEIYSTQTFKEESG